MKVLILSDSHGMMQNMKTAIEREQPDRVFHLGDVLSDVTRLGWAYPDLQIDAVAGNCDGSVKAPGTQLITVDGVTFFLTHGHRYQVKLALGSVVRAGQEAHADVICFGHTHKALCDRWPDGTWVVNPGTAGGIHNKASYGVVEIEDGTIRARIESL